MAAEGEYERMHDQLQRLALVERRYREMLLGNPTHPKGDALKALVTDGDFGVAWVAEPHRDGLQIERSAGTRTDALDRLAIRPGEGLTGKVFRSGEIDWVDEYFAAGSITHDFDGQIRGEQVERLIAVPLIHEGTVVGVIAAGSRTGGLFGGVAVDHLVSTAGSISLQAIIAERERRLAERVAAEERRQVAMDLHDSLGAMLYSIGSDARGLRDLLDELENPEPGAAERLERITAHTAEASILLREALRSLHATPGEVALTASLEADCRAFETRSGVSTHVVVLADSVPLPNATVAFALRALREALLNVEKHASATMVAVTVSTTQDHVVITVADDGVGMRPSSSDREVGGTSGLGLPGTAVAAERLGGWLETRNGDDCGLVWRLQLPR